MDEVEQLLQEAREKFEKGFVNQASTFDQASTEKKLVDCIALTGKKIKIMTTVDFESALVNLKSNHYERVEEMCKAAVCRLSSPHDDLLLAPSDKPTLALKMSSAALTLKNAFGIGLYLHSVIKKAIKEGGDPSPHHLYLVPNLSQEVLSMLLEDSTRKSLFTWPVAQLYRILMELLDKWNQFCCSKSIHGANAPTPRSLPPRLPLIGIPNLGQSCYLNPVLQSLRMHPELKESSLSLKALSNVSPYGHASLEPLMNLLDALQEIPYKDVVLIEDIPRFKKQLLDCDTLNFPEHYVSNTKIRMRACQMLHYSLSCFPLSSSVFLVGGFHILSAETGSFPGNQVSCTCSHCNPKGCFFVLSSIRNQADVKRAVSVSPTVCHSSYAANTVDSNFCRIRTCRHWILYASGPFREPYPSFKACSNPVCSMNVPPGVIKENVSAIESGAT